MLRRPPTLLALTSEDVSAYEDRRKAEQEEREATMGTARSRPGGNMPSIEWLRENGHLPSSDSSGSSSPFSVRGTSNVQEQHGAQLEQIREHETGQQYRLMQAQQHAGHASRAGASRRGRLLRSSPQRQQEEEQEEEEEEEGGDGNNDEAGDDDDEEMEDYLPHQHPSLPPVPSLIPITNATTPSIPNDPYSSMRATNHDPYDSDFDSDHRQHHHQQHRNHNHNHRQNQPNNNTTNDNNNAGGNSSDSDAPDYSLAGARQRIPHSGRGPSGRPSSPTPQGQGHGHAHHHSHQQSPNPFHTPHQLHPHQTPPHNPALRTPQAPPAPSARMGTAAAAWGSSYAQHTTPPNPNQGFNVPGIGTTAAAAAAATAGGSQIPGAPPRPGRGTRARNAAASTATVTGTRGPTTRARGGTDEAGASATQGQQQAAGGRVTRSREERIGIPGGAAANGTGLGRRTGR